MRSHKTATIDYFSTRLFRRLVDETVHNILQWSVTRPLSRRLAPLPPAGIVRRRRRRRKTDGAAADPAEVIGRRRRRNFYGQPP